MELRQLRYFVAVAEELSFSRAAQKLSLVQPALSQQIAALEKELGAQLLLRTKRQITLTMAGQTFLEEARLILARVEKAIAVTQAVARGEHGQLVVGYSGFVQHRLFPQMIRTFRDAFPNVELVLRQLVGDQQIQQLINGQLDVGFVVYSAHTLSGSGKQWLQQETFAVEPIVAVLPKEHRYAQQKSVTLHDLKKDNLIWLPPNFARLSYEYTAKIFDEASYQPARMLSVNDGWTATSLVITGTGISFGPASVQTMGREMLSYPEVVGANWQADFNILWNKANLTPPVQAFINVVREVIKLAA